MKIVCDTGFSNDIQILDKDGNDLLQELSPVWLTLDFSANSFVKMVMQLNLAEVDVEVVGEITVVPKDKE